MFLPCSRLQKFLTVLIGIGSTASLAFASVSSAQSAPAGRWSGPIQIQGIELATHVYFNDDGSATIDIPVQGAFGLPLINVTVSVKSVYFELQAGPGLAVFTSETVSPDRIEGIFTQGTATGTFYLQPDPDTSVEVEHAPDSEVSVEVDGGTVFGSLAVPAHIQAPDLLILHAGSGPTTRDGNSQGAAGRNNSLLLLSDALVEKGLAVLRYDKRSVGKSAPTAEADLRIDTYVDDLIAWVTKIRDEASFGRIFLVGHSEGALIVSLAAQRTDDIDGIILIAGAGRPMSKVLLEQLERNLPATLYAESVSIVADLVAGKTVDSTPTELASLFRPSVQPYLISFFALDPAAVFGAVGQAALILQGTTDIQISVEDARNLAAANSDARLLIIEGMNHVLKDVGGDRAAQLPSYGDPSLPVNVDLVDSIAEFVASLK